MKTRCRFLRYICCGLLLFPLLFGCASGEKHGDAVLSPGGQGLPFKYAGSLSFPPVPIGTRGITRFRVLDLPTVIYPLAFELAVPEAKTLKIPPNAPWRNCIVQTSLLTLDGRVFHSRTIDFGRAKGDGMTIPLIDAEKPDRTVSIPQYRSYTIEIRVIRPSLRVSDRITIYAPTDFGVPRN